MGTTSGQIAESHGVPLDMALYAIRAINAKPAMRLGPIRLFGPEVAENIGAKIKQLMIRRARLAATAAKR